MPMRGSFEQRIAHAQARAYMQQLGPYILRLPREVRDMIYAQLWNRAPPPIFDLIWAHDHKWNTGCRGPPCICLQGLPHFIDTNLVGHQLAAEIIESGRKVAGSYLFHYHVRAGELEDFVTADPFHVGITREQVFRNMDLLVDFSEFIVKDAWQWEKNKDVTMKQLQSAVDLLMKIPLGKPRHIMFEIQHCFEHPFNLGNVLRMLCPAFIGLRDKGFDVRLWYKHHELDIEWQLGMAVWHWTPDEWRENLRNLDEVDVGFWNDTMTTMTPHTTSIPSFMLDEQFESWEPYWNIIMQDLYQVDVDVLNQGFSDVSLRQSAEHE
ncbi:hypothetical protein K504DRAFT_59034 [Pleomassaria siparia CBS 279.74]|uniref:Uncharacterized protein n=1 Tax=Pleomassaria siparia CBS 279.74 TaxID=1314801 RepID=A0A6G1K205_9PLEO|nr:hypothetical protein K504DRAFT_59034 [Pleomassaria siparia CBS 279.74]